MMKITVDRIATEVATLMGESLALECRPHESPFPDIVDKVRVATPGILHDLITDAKAEMLTDAKRLAPEVSIGPDGVGTLRLPDDFLRLVYVKMNDWSRPVTSVTPFSDPSVSLQYSPWNGVRGTPQRPVAVMDAASGSLKLFTCGKGSALESFLYVPKPVIAADDTLETPEALYPQLIRNIVNNASCPSL
ncbi:MAG: hypothetical protein J1F67_11195 [Muribaculaceae bacterium]|nr:hypothetical protein [Muribaculaceae bacterium]